MSVVISSNDTTSQSRVHLLPCTVKTNGPAKVDTFFTTIIQEGEAGYTSTFRGRELRGRTLSVPDGFKGIILQEPNRPFIEDHDRSLRISGQFDEFTYWNLQTPPSEQDKIARALQWAKLSSVIHSPVSEEENSSPSSSVEFSR